MRTLVISDLHLGSRTQVDVLRRPAALQALCSALQGFDRLVLLGDALELRHGPTHDALEAARPVLGAIGEALGPDAEVVLTCGNHDFRLIAPWLDSRAAHQPLGLEERAGPRASAPIRAIAEMLQPATLDVAHPGLWLADGVYATHGHYLDRHLTVPTIERLAAGVLARVLDSPAASAATPDDYERVLAPIYALVDAMAARTTDGRGEAAANVSARAWTSLSSDGPRPWQGRALASAIPLAVGVLNRSGIGPLRAELSGVELRRAGLAAIGAVVAQLGIGARHVVFGHTHRAGPLEGDDRGEWTLPGGARLHNTGCWVYEAMYIVHDWGNPYWPGSAIELDDEDGGAPRLRRLLGGCDPADLRPPEAPAPA